MTKRIVQMALAVLLTAGLWQGAAAQSTTPNEKTLFVVTKTTADGTRLGFIDKTGKMVIAPIYKAYDIDLVEDIGESSQKMFHDGLCLVQYPDTSSPTGWLWGYINLDGNIVVSEKTLPKDHYLSGMDFSDGRSVVVYTTNTFDRDSYRYGCIDVKGQVVIPAQYKDMTSFSDGLALAIDTLDSVGFIDTAGNWAIPVNSGLQFQTMFNEGLAHAVIEATNDPDGISRNGFVDKSGNWVIRNIPGLFKDQFSEGLVTCGDFASDKFGYLDKQGNWAIKPQFSYAKSFSDGMAAVKYTYSGEKWGYVDKNGNEAILPLYDEAFDFSEGKALVRIEQHGMFIDKKGNIAVDMTEVHKLAINYIREVGRYIESQSSNAHISWEMVGNYNIYCSNFKDGLAPFTISYRPTGYLYNGYINTQGKIVYKDCLEPLTDEKLSEIISGIQTYYNDLMEELVEVDSVVADDWVEEGIAEPAEEAVEVEEVIVASDDELPPPPPPSYDILNDGEDRNIGTNIVIIEEEEEEEIDENEIFTVVEEDPEFPGGQEALMKYLAENIIYPIQAKENNVTGKVWVSFVVEKDGSITNARVLRNIGAGCGEEAMRIVENMPRWTPGKNRGKPVRVQYNVPVNFQLK